MDVLSFSHAGLDAPGAVKCLLLKQPDTKRPRELRAPTGEMSSSVNPAGVPHEGKQDCLYGRREGGESPLKNVIEEFS